MGIFSRFERGMEDGLEGAANKVFNAPISPVQISKKAERAMRREKMVGAGKQYAPTLYTVLVNPQDDARLFGYYPTLAGETETYLSAKAAEEGFLMDGQPLVRFIVDEGLRRGKFDVVAELVSAPIIAQLRQEEMRRYGLATSGSRGSQVATQQSARAQAQAARDAQAYRYGNQPAYIPPVEQTGVHRPVNVHSTEQSAEQSAAQSAVKEPLPFVPEDEIDRSIDYGEYTFNSQDWDSYQKHGPSSMPIPEVVPAPDPAVDLGANLPSIDEAEEAGFDVGRTPESVSSGVIESALEPASIPSVETIDNTIWAEELDATGFDEGIDGADLSGLDVEAFDPAEVDSRDFMVPDQVDEVMQVPDTAMFAAGAGQGMVMPDQQAVRARLTNAAGTRSIDLAANRLIIGRSSSCDIMVDDINASRNHAELRCEANGDWVVNDLGATNGTLVNGRRITSHRLFEGDRIRIGTTDFVFTLR